MKEMEKAYVKLEIAYRMLEEIFTFPIEEEPSGDLARLTVSLTKVDEVLDNILVAQVLMERSLGFSQEKKDELMEKLPRSLKSSCEIIRKRRRK